MNSDEVNWLLQTIEDPENAKRFVRAQYQRGRIPYHVMASLAQDRNWTDWPAVDEFRDHCCGSNSQGNGCRGI
jgi:hypothetical protein